jgi:tetratricopeptide (TPR) repeat protein
MGDNAVLADTAAILARSLCDQRRLDEAWEFTDRAERAAADDDVSAQIGWRSVRGRILARRGDTATAQVLATEAVDLAARTDWLNDHADALLALGDVLLSTGAVVAAEDSIRAGIALYERKGNTIGVRGARSLLEARATV